MSRIKVLAYAYQFQEMFLSKDIFLIPYYIARELGGAMYVSLYPQPG